MHKEQKNIGISDSDIYGIEIEKVYGRQKTGDFFLCLSKSLILFFVVIGNVIGFCDAFSLEYSKPVIILYTFFGSVISAFIFSRKNGIHLGVIAYIVLNILCLWRFSYYVAGGLRTLSDRIREAYGDHYNHHIVMGDNPYYDNEHVGITIVLLFIISLLLILFSITIVRYMNFAETLFISLIILEFPFFIGEKPDIIPLALVMIGCIAIGMLQHGSFIGGLFPFEENAGFYRDKRLGKIRYTSGTNYKGVLMVLAFSAVFSVAALLISYKVYESNTIGKSTGDGIKAFLDEKADIVARNGIYGLFEEEEITTSVISNGQLGKVRTIENDNEPDLIVRFIPYSSDPIYLAGFRGIQYKDMQWSSKVSVADFPDIFHTDAEYVDYSVFEYFDKSITSTAINNVYSPVAKMQIKYVDDQLEKNIYPYFTLRNGIRWSLMDDHTQEADFYVPNRIVYKNLQNAYVEFSSLNLLLKMKEQFSYVIGKKERQSFTGYDYIDGLCLDVPESLGTYLDGFVKNHDYFGIDQESMEKYGRSNTYDELQEEKTEDYSESNPDDSYIIVYSEKDLSSYSDISKIIASSSSYRIVTFDFNKTLEQFEEIERIDEYRIQVCDAIKEMLAKEYVYTLSPGKTPLDTDYVQYFLEYQKKGLCTHFATAAIMLLRYMGVPARYAEGYCIPSYLIKQLGKEIEVDERTWFKENNYYNLEKKAYEVEVSDYYAHAWVEVYLEGKGFVPFEMTPATFLSSSGNDKGGTNTPTPTPTPKPTPTPRPTVTPKPTGSESDKTEPKENAPTLTPTPTNAVNEKPRVISDAERFIRMVLLALGLVVAGCMLVFLTKKGVHSIRCAIYLKEGKYKQLVYIRYCELVDRMKRKKLIMSENPLPMEMCVPIAEYVTKAEIKKKKVAVSDYTETPFYKKIYAGYAEVFGYMEKVLYSSYETNESEYSDFNYKLSLLK